jgi:ABC-2 type transport system permease protein
MATIVLFTLIGSLEVPIFEKIRPFLFTSHMLAWRYFFEDPVPYAEVWYSAKILLAHIIGLMALSLYVFHKKDILS